MNKNVYISQFEVFSQLINLIPPEITSLLWFADGSLKNYSSEKLSTFKTDFFTIAFSQEVEPSLTSSRENSPAERRDESRFDNQDSFAKIRLLESKE